MEKIQQMLDNGEAQYEVPAKGHAAVNVPTLTYRSCYFVTIEGADEAGESYYDDDSPVFEADPLELQDDLIGRMPSLQDPVQVDPETIPQVDVVHSVQLEDTMHDEAEHLVVERPEQSEAEGPDE